MDIVDTGICVAAVVVPVGILIYGWIRQGKRMKDEDRQVEEWVRKCEEAGRKEWP